MYLANGCIRHENYCHWGTVFRIRLPRTPFGVATAAGCCVIATGISTPAKG